MKRILIAAVLISLMSTAGASAAEPSWGALETQFTQMPMEARRLTGPLFWLHGDANETKERLELYLDKVAEGHNGSFCAESRPHSDWLGPRWFSDLDICLQHAKALDLKMWIFDEKWWPSQTVANKVPAEYRAKKLETSAELVTGPLSLTTAVTGNMVAVIAGRRADAGIDANSLVDLTPSVRDKSLSWDVPTGDWEIMKLAWIEAPRTNQAGQVSVDGASKDCVDWFLRTVYQPHYDRFKADFGKSIVGFFYDEPETQGDWGTELSKTFAERGVDWKKALVAWKFKLAGEEQIAAKYAYVDALAETWGRTMYGGTLQWCEDRGVQFIGHFIEHDGWYLKPGLGAINLFDMQKYNSMGGMDLVCQQLWPGQRNPGIYQIPKLTSSISHAYNKRDDLAMTEIFGAYGQGITYPQMKWLADWHQVRGVNFLIPHSFNPRAPNDTDCPPYFYADDAEPRFPLYRVWADYTNRLSLMLTGGAHVCPVAFLFCGNSAYVGKAVTPEDMTTNLQDALYDCDWLPYEVFEGNASISGKEIKLYRERYRVLIVPPVEAIPYATLAKVKQFFDAGGVVIAYDFLPSESASLGRASEDIRGLVNAIWGSVKPGSNVCKTNSAGGRSYFLSAIGPEDLRKVLAADAGVHPTLEVLAGETNHWLHILHRRKSGRDVFLVCNQNHEGESKTFHMRATAKGEPQCWDAMRNEITSLPYKRVSADAVEFDLTLSPSESVLLVFGPKSVNRPMRLSSDSRPSRTIPVERTNAPRAESQPSKLNLSDCPWVWHPEVGDQMNAPPGTRWFRGEISIPAGRTITGARFLISADNDFVLYVNGREAGRSTPDGEGWRRPKELDISAFLSSGTNVLAIAATNGSNQPNPAGLIGRYAIEFASGGPIIGCIDATWQASNREEPGWNAPGFDAAAWARAKEIAVFGAGPWGNLTGAIVPADPFLGRCELPTTVNLGRSRVYLEMDDLREGASVKVNGAFAGGVIGEPFRLDVTKHLKPGANTIEIEPYAPKSVRLAVRSP